MKTLSVKQILSVFLFSIVVVSVSAQKLPTEQEGSLRAPAAIKIDGKATELNNTFQAFNRHTDFYYTMSNDDNNLYLTIQATDPTVIRRITNGGITLTINKSGQKKDKDGMSITYPVFEKNNRFMPNLKPVNITTMGNGTTIVDVRMTEMHADAITAPTERPDSFVNITNKNFTEKAKFIHVTGIKDVDSLISVYNVDGIKAAALFDNKMAYTYELAVSLKKLGLTTDNPQKFAYQVKINEVTMQGITFTTTGGSSATESAAPMLRNIAVGSNFAVGQSATDFWGEYTLAK